MWDRLYNIVAVIESTDSAVKILTDVLIGITAFTECSYPFDAANRNDGVVHQGPRIRWHCLLTVKPYMQSIMAARFLTGCFPSNAVQPCPLKVLVQSLNLSTWGVLDLYVNITPCGQRPCKIDTKV